MPVKVMMPQMGESVAEGTVVRWMKRPGERVERDEPLLEISTDKVDAEIPSPAAGVLTKILAKENETVEVNTVIAEIESDWVQPATAAEDGAPTRPPADQPTGTSGRGALGAPPAPQNVRSSPVVRKLAKEHGIDLSLVPGTGLGGPENYVDQAIASNIEPLMRPLPTARETAAASGPACGS